LIGVKNIQIWRLCAFRIYLCLFILDIYVAEPSLKTISVSSLHMYFYWVAIIMPKMPFQKNVVQNKERNRNNKCCQNRNRKNLSVQNLNKEVILKLFFNYVYIAFFPYYDLKPNISKPNVALT
jgi:hypothetical protein